MVGDKGNDKKAIISVTQFKIREIELQMKNFWLQAFSLVSVIRYATLTESKRQERAAPLILKFLLRNPLGALVLVLKEDTTDQSESQASDEKSRAPSRSCATIALASVSHWFSPPLRQFLLRSALIQRRTLRNKDQGPGYHSNRRPHVSRRHRFYSGRLSCVYPRVDRADALEC